MRNLTEDWTALLSSFGTEPALVQEALAQVQDAYSAPGRFYHTLEHIGYVLDVIDALRGLAGDLRAVQLAAWLHDVVYDTKARDNEERSALFAQQLLARAAVDASTVRAVATMIRKTRDHENPDGDEDTQVLLDADLAILGAPAQEYDRYAQAIRQEYSWVPQTQYRAGRRQVLQRFLDRRRIHGTEPMFRARESQARDNLTRELSNLS